MTRWQVWLECVGVTALRLLMLNPLRWLLRQVFNLLLRLTGRPLLEDERVQPVPDLGVTFRVGAWAELDLEGVDEELHPESFTLAHLGASAALIFREITDDAAGVSGTLAQLLAAAPPSMFSPARPPRRTAHGVDVVEGGSGALGYSATWLVYWNGRALLVGLFDKGRSPRVHRDACSLVDSAAPLR